MKGLGTLINVGAILGGGVLGLLLGRFFTERFQQTLLRATGLCVCVLGISGALEQMFSLENGKIASHGELMLIVSVTLGSLIGELINFDRLFEKFGEWLKKKTGNGSDPGFTNAFLTASFTVCIGAMAIYGSVIDGISGDHSVLILKSVIDFAVLLPMASTLGKGCIFSALPVAALQGAFTLGAVFISPYMTENAVSYLSLTGSVLLICIGYNLIKPKTFRVANMVPAVFISVVWAFL